MKRKKTWIPLLVVIVSGSGAFYFLKSDSSSEEGQEDPFVVAEVGTVIEKALAGDPLNPRIEIEIKSKNLGVVSKILAETGEYVREGQPLTRASSDGYHLLCTKFLRSKISEKMQGKMPKCANFLSFESQFKAK